MSDSDEDTKALQNWSNVWDSMVEIPTASMRGEISFSENKSKINLSMLNDKMDMLLRRLETIEDKMDQISSDLSINNSVPVSTPYKPFYNKEIYMSTQNFSVLNDNVLIFRIIIMSDSESITLYPFGKQKVNTVYQDWSYPCYIKDIQDNTIGTLYLHLQMINDVYTMTIDSTIYETEINEKKDIRELDRPFVITFEEKLL